MDMLQNMRAYVHVVDSGSFTEAARTMKATTGQVSRSVSALEDHLSTRLLHRTTRRLAVTEAGERYAQHCRQILGNIERAEAEARSALTHPTGTLRVHVMATFGQHYVVPTAVRYQKVQPTVAVELTFSQTMPNLLADGFDVSLILAPELPDSELVSRRLGSVLGVVCASPGYIRERGMPSVPAELQTHTCVQLNSPFFPPDRWQFVKETAVEDVALGLAVLRVNTSEALELALSSGAGIGVLPGPMAQEGLRSGKLIRVLPTFALRKLNLYLVYASREYVDAKIRSWIDFCIKEIPGILANDALGACASS